MRAFKILSIVILFTILAFSVQGSSLAAPLAQTSGPLASVEISARSVTWQLLVTAAGFQLSVVLPDGSVIQRDFPESQIPALDCADFAGGACLDGQYFYELKAVPQLSPETRARLEAARQAGTEEAVIRELQQAGLLPAALPVQSGSFTAARGEFLPAGFVAEPLPDQVTPDDLIVQGSGCFGFDCVENEAFGFDTLMLKENNLQIFFNDTSSTAGFPANKWRIVANSSASGGANYLAIQDATAGTVPFTISAGARANALYIGPTGNVGMGTTAPGKLIHLLNSDTPTIRLEQDSGTGFTAQTWDIGANEANFFVRDLTAGSRLPFRIRPGAPTSSVDIHANGDVGIGTASPEARLHVVGNALVAGNLQVNGYVSELSDRDAKQNFAPVDGAQVLEQLQNVPVLTWNYKGDADVQHIGPVAQDFYAAFGLGADEKHIAPLDVNGVTLAAVQELDRRVQEKDARIQALETRLAALEAGQTAASPLAPFAFGLLGLLLGAALVKRLGR